MPRVVGDWTREKLRILESYLPAYLSATQSALERIYIDAFAGPGTNVLRNSQIVIPGSPLIAVNARAPGGARFTRLIFIENKPSLAKELRSHIGGDRRCEIYDGDVNEVLPRVIRTIHRRAPTFIFLDTAGVDPRWETIEAVAPWQVEFLINFPLGMSIKRNPDSAKTRAYFGTDEFYPLLKYRGIGKARALLDLYKSRLAGLGLTETIQDDRLIKTQNEKRLYYLVFVGKHPAGERIMSSVFRQPDASGQGRLQL
jgi:three-Cys-motif partner protein